MFGVFNFTSLQEDGDNVKYLQELKKLNNAVDESNIDIIVNNKNDAVILNNKNISVEITDLSKKNQDIKVKNIKNTKGDEIITVEATTSQSSNYLGNILKSIVSSASAASGLFINKKNVDNDGNIKMNNTVSSEKGSLPSETNVDVDIAAVNPVETIPFINKITDDNDIVINIPSKKKYIGIPKNVMMRDDNNDDKIILNDLLKGGIIEKIEVDQNLLDEEKIPRYNENNYDYYELKIEEHLRDRIRSINSIIHGELNVLSQNNTLYIYEIEPDQATGVSNLSANTLFNNISGAISGASKNALSTLVGKITGESKKTKGKEEEIDESIIETNNKPPKCNKKTTAKNMKKTSGSKGTPTSNKKPSTFESVTRTLKNIIPLSPQSNKRVTRSNSTNK
jgi:hypothetical protein